MRAWIVVLMLALGACSAKEEPPPPAEAPPEGRAETQSIRNTEAVGTGGAAVADKVDDALNKTEEATKKNQQAADQAGE